MKKKHATADVLSHFLLLEEIELSFMMGCRFLAHYLAKCTSILKHEKPRNRFSIARR